MKHLQNLVAAFQECAISWNELNQHIAEPGGGDLSSDLAWNLSRLGHYGR